MSRKRLNRQGPEQIAQCLGRRNALKINSLHVYDGRVTGNMAIRASARAVVEFSGRASAGFAR
jgi:hypothetical protein